MSYKKSQFSAVKQMVFCKNGHTERHAFRVRMDEMTCTRLP